MQNQSFRWRIAARAFNLAFWSNSRDFARFDALRSRLLVIRRVF